jgi:Family of unknown function (DUF6624)
MQRLMVIAFAGLGLLIGSPRIAFAQNEKKPDKADEKKTNDALGNELLRMLEEDKVTRDKFTELLKTPAGRTGRLSAETPEIKAVQQVTRKNTDRLKAIVAKHGWPGKSLVGDEAANAAWLLVQQAVYDRPFQRRCLQLMEEAAKKGEVSKRDVAYLADLLLVADGKKQRYGTQFKLEKGEWVPSPIEDLANVDKRRAELEMPPLADYKKMINDQYLNKAKEEKGKEDKK